MGSLTMPKTRLIELMRQLEYRSLQAERASEKWEKRKAQLERYCDRNKYTEEQKRNKFRIDWDLNDAMDSWNWNRREANRIAQFILAEKAFRDMIGRDAMPSEGIVIHAE